MSPRIACLLTIAACLYGCQNAAPKLAGSERIVDADRAGAETTIPGIYDTANESNAITTVTQDYSSTQLTSLPIGGDCMVQTTDPTRSVHGTIAEVTPAGIVLVDAEEMVEAHHSSGVPIMNKVPYTSRMFKNVGIGRDVRPVGSVTIPSSEVAFARVSQVMRPSVPAN